MQCVFYLLNCVWYLFLKKINMNKRKGRLSTDDCVSNHLHRSINIANIFTNVIQKFKDEFLIYFSVCVCV